MRRQGSFCCGPALSQRLTLPRGKVLSLTRDAEAAALKDTAMLSNVEVRGRLEQDLLSLYRRALSAGCLDVAEHLLRALEQLAATGSSCAALDAGYLDLAAHARRRPGSGGRLT